MRFHSQKKKLSWRWGAKHYHSTIHNAKALPLVDDIGTCNSNISRKLTASQPATEGDEDQRGDEEGYADFATCNNEDDDDASDNENGDENENATLDASDQLVDISQRVIPTEVFDTTKKIAPMLLQLWTPQPFKNHLNSTNFPVKLSPISMYKQHHFRTKVRQRSPKRWTQSPCISPASLADGFHYRCRSLEDPFEQRDDREEVMLVNKAYSDEEETESAKWCDSRSRLLTTSIAHTKHRTSICLPVKAIPYTGFSPKSVGRTSGSTEERICLLKAEAVETQNRIKPYNLEGILDRHQHRFQTRHKDESEFERPICILQGSMATQAKGEGDNQSEDRREEISPALPHDTPTFLASSVTTKAGKAISDDAVSLQMMGLDGILHQESGKERASLVSSKTLQDRVNCKSQCTILHERRRQSSRKMRSIASHCGNYSHGACMDALHGDGDLSTVTELPSEEERTQASTADCPARPPIDILSYGSSLADSKSVTALNDDMTIEDNFLLGQIQSSSIEVYLEGMEI
jgi:hypothetical protein